MSRTYNCIITADEKAGGFVEVTSPSGSSARIEHRTTTQKDCPDRLIYGRVLGAYCTTKLKTQPFVTLSKDEMSRWIKLFTYQESIK